MRPQRRRHLETVVVVAGAITGLLSSPVAAGIDGAARIGGLLAQAEVGLQQGDVLATLQPLEEAVALLQAQAPLVLANLTHASADVSTFRDVWPRDPVYQPGEVLRLYFEPRYFTVQEEDRGRYAVHLLVGAQVRHQDGSVVFDSPRFLDYQLTGARRQQDVFVQLSFDLDPSLAPGTYTVHLTLTDLLSQRTASAETTFELRRDVSPGRS